LGEKNLLTPPNKSLTTTREDWNMCMTCAKHKEYVGVAYMILCENFEDKEANEYHKFIKAHKDYKK
jgi:hypothetical protein